MKAACASWEELQRLQEEDRAKGRDPNRQMSADLTALLLELDDDALAALAERLRPFLTPNGGEQS
jgi:hypothetical protein